MGDTDNGIYEQTIGRVIVLEQKCVTKKWMEREYDKRVVDFCHITLLQILHQMKQLMMNVMLKIRIQ